MGKEIINTTFNLSVDYIFECLFTHSKFNKKYWAKLKFENVNISEWKPVDSIETRVMEYNMSVAAIGKLRNTQHEAILKKTPNKRIVIEVVTSAQGVLYSDYFKLTNRYCITKCTDTTSRLVVRYSLLY